MSIAFLLYKSWQPNWVALQIEHKPISKIGNAATYAETWNGSPRRCAIAAACRRVHKAKRCNGGISGKEIRWWNWHNVNRLLVRVDFICLNGVFCI
jgi:hypothetical protein